MKVKIQFSPNGRSVAYSHKSRLTHHSKFEQRTHQKCACSAGRNERRGPSFILFFFMSPPLTSWGFSRDNSCGIKTLGTCALPVCQMAVCNTVRWLADNFFFEEEEKKKLLFYARRLFLEELFVPSSLSKHLSWLLETVYTTVYRHIAFMALSKV